MSVRIITGDCRDVLRTLPDESVHCVVTSPPYWGLRDYGTAQWDGGDLRCDHLGAPFRTKSKLNENWGAGFLDVKNAEGREPMLGDCSKCGARRIDSQLGLERSLGEHIAVMVEVFREVRRVLRRDGSLWLNYGDSYAGGGRGGGSEDCKQRTNVGSLVDPSPIPIGLKPKDLCGVPWRVAFALQADGWWLRSDIIWSKPNPMPESVTDRPTKAHEYLFLLTKSATYYYDQDAIREEPTGRTDPITSFGHVPNRNDANSNGYPLNGLVGRNKRTVWEIATAPFSEAHFATFPPALIEPCIKAGTSEKGCCAKCGAPWVRAIEVVTHTGSYHNHSDDRGAGMSQSQPNNLRGSDYYQNYRPPKNVGWLPACSCFLIAGEIPQRRAPGHLGESPAPCLTTPCTVLDPFGGAGTTGLVADRLQRNAILIELNPAYAEMARRRIDGDAPLFAMPAQELAI